MRTEDSRAPPEFDRFVSRLSRWLAGQRLILVIPIKGPPFYRQK